MLPPVTPPMQQDRFLLSKTNISSNNGISSRKDIASAMAGGFPQSERPHGVTGEEGAAAIGLARLQYSVDTIGNNGQATVGNDTTLSAYTLSQAKLTAATPGTAGVAFNY